MKNLITNKQSLGDQQEEEELGFVVLCVAAFPTWPFNFFHGPVSQKTKKKLQNPDASLFGFLFLCSCLSHLSLRN